MITFGIVWLCLAGITCGVFSRLRESTDLDWDFVEWEDEF